MPSAPLTPDELEAALNDLPGWCLDGDKLTRPFKFRNFREAMAFVLRVSYEAEGMDHHPDIFLSYNRLILTLSTHDAGDRVTAKDVELARRLNKLVQNGAVPV